MSSPQDVTMNQDDDSGSRSHEPFTLEENIEQLNGIDKSVVELMNHTATALNALTIPTLPTASNPPAEVSKPALDPASQKDAFRSATDSFLDTLHSIDVRMKRQVLALEEAGIVRLSNTGQEDKNSGSKTSLKPNGLGAVGKLDVGWLNSRGTRVERDMEVEIWEQAKLFLEQESEKSNIS